MRAGIHEEALHVMLEGGALREFLVSRHDEKWIVAIRLRTWATLTAAPCQNVSCRTLTSRLRA
ncbi:hypothetical protein B0F86_15290 [Pseudomonas syringae]|nr:hypothetical protein B0F86_15290 [Pseudomonas syringae]